MYNIIQMQNEGATIKSENIRGLHEEYESTADENEASDKVPLDAKVLHYILESMGAPHYEPRVIHQLLEFIHRTHHKTRMIKKLNVSVP